MAFCKYVRVCARVGVCVQHVFVWLCVINVFANISIHQQKWF